MLKKWQKQHRGFIALLLGIFFLSGLLAVRYDRLWDFSLNQREQLSETSVNLVNALESPLQITAFVRGNPKVKTLINRLLQRYQRHGDISWTFKNPDAEIDAVRQYGISRDGELLLRYGNQQLLVSTLNETAISRGIYTLLQGKTRQVLLASGNGEKHFLNDDEESYSLLKAKLSENDIALSSVDLSISRGIPDNIDALVLAAPKRPYSQEEITSIDEYLKKGGRLLWLASHGNNGEQAGLSRLLGVRFLPGQLIGQAGKALGLDDPTYVPIVPKVDESSELLAGIDSLLAFPSAAPIAVLPTDAAKKWQQSAFLTPAGQWLSKAENTISKVATPVVIGMQLTPKTGGQAKVILIGDADFAANRYIGLGQNGDFAVNVFRQLAAPDSSHIRIDSEMPEPVTLSEKTLAYWTLSVLLGLPLVILIFGFWLRRRLR